MAKPSKRSVFREKRHVFEFKIPDGRGKFIKHKAYAKVRPSRKQAHLDLRAEHVHRAEQLEGCGNSATCTMANCCSAQSSSFIHPVEGHVDFERNRAFIVSKRTGAWPSECWAYEHNYSWITEMNDDPKGGYERLLQRIADEGGSIPIVLYPYRKRSDIGRSGKGRSNTGKRIIKRRGSRGRADIAQLGAMSQFQRDEVFGK